MRPSKRVYVWPWGRTYSTTHKCVSRGGGTSQAAAHTPPSSGDEKCGRAPIQILLPHQCIAAVAEVVHAPAWSIQCNRKEGTWKPTSWWPASPPRLLGYSPTPAHGQRNPYTPRWGGGGDKILPSPPSLHNSDNRPRPTPTPLLNLGRRYTKKILLSASEHQHIWTTNTNTKMATNTPQVRGPAHLYPLQSRESCLLCKIVKKQKWRETHQIRKNGEENVVETIFRNKTNKTRGETDTQYYPWRRLQ